MKTRAIMTMSFVWIVWICCALGFAPVAQAAALAETIGEGRSPEPARTGPASVTPEKASEIKARFGALQLPFVRSESQDTKSRSRVKFLARTITGGVLVEDAGVVYTVSSAGRKGGDKPLSIRESFVGSRKDTKARGVKESKARVNYFKGGDASKWKRNLETYDIVGLGNIYDGIELQLAATNRNMEKVFIVEPGAGPEKIAARIEGIQALKVGKSGALELKTKAGVLTMTPPVAYQERDGKRSIVQAAYRVIDRNTYGFKIGEYDKSAPLIIDPLLASTFLGDTGVDYGYGIAVDATGSVYVTGWTNSMYFPVTDDAYSVNYEDGYDVFVSQLSNDLSSLQASTFLGGSSDEYAYSVTVDSSGNVVIGGITKSNDFPVTSTAYAKKLIGGTDIFIAKVGTTTYPMDTLIASTYFGGVSTDQLSTLMLDAADNVYFAGSTQSKDFPITVKSAYDMSYAGGGDAFIAILDSGLSSLTASTFLGGASADQINAMAFDSAANLYTIGYTKSTDFPTTPFALYRVNKGKTDAFVTKFTANATVALKLSLVEASTYIGGTADDVAMALVIDATDVVYVAGYTSSTNFPIKRPCYDRSHNGSDDGFVARLSWDAVSTPARLRLDVSTYIGGSSSDYLRAIALDSSGDVFVAGSTKSTNYPVITGTSYDETSNKGEDVIASQFDSDLTQLKGSTYFGGASDDRAHAMVVDSSGVIYLIGATKSSSFPVSETAYQATFGGGSKEDVFISTFSSLDK